MIGFTRHETVEDVELAWQTWANQNGLRLRWRNGDTHTDLRTSRKLVRAYVSGGKWIADCPNCNGGMAVWSENPRCCCLDCGTIYRVDHATDKERQAAERLLAPRFEADRNWHRHRGEKLENLDEENKMLLKSAALSTGAVAASDIREILGDEAFDKLQAAGAV